MKLIYLYILGLLLSGSILSQTIAAGLGYYLVVDENGTLWTWGYNHFGQLGLGDWELRKSCQEIPALKDIVRVVAKDRSVALDAAGVVWAWGYNKNGQIGCEYSTYVASPVRINIDRRVKAVALGYQHTLALDEEGQVWIWGNFREHKDYGEGPTLLNIPEQIIQIAAGERHALAVDCQGRVWSWGNNNCGQLGLGYLSESEAPMCIKVPLEVVSIVAEGNCSFALDDDGKLWVWGATDPIASLSNDTAIKLHTPTLFSFSSRIFSLSVRKKFIAVLDEAQQVWMGEIILSAAFAHNQEPALKLVENLRDSVEIDITPDHLLVLDKNGQLLLWRHKEEFLPERCIIKDLPPIKCPFFRLPANGQSCS